MALNRMNIVERFPALSEGLIVYSLDGERLGKVALLGEDHFIVQKGIFFPKDFSLRYDEIENIDEDGVRVKLGEEQLGQWREGNYEGWNRNEELNRSELNVPITEEKID